MAMNVLQKSGEERANYLKYKAFVPSCQGAPEALLKRWSAMHPARCSQSVRLKGNNSPRFDPS